MQSKIDRIIDIEWRMFDKVRNVSGRADCQDDRETFDIMRRSQFEAWSDALVSSCLSDLLEAERQGRNPLTEKYAYMMEYTAPDEFQKIKSALPFLSDRKKQLVRGIVDEHLERFEEAARRFPLTIARGRPKSGAMDGTDCTSTETYLLGELSTCSERTLEEYERYMTQLRESGQNIVCMILENTARKYGHKSLEALEEFLAVSESP
ncbi:MAG: DUF4125 family protein [Synergistaceae bacterium]|nr:DUF4125 family protein [Synergistaceae bacterium]